jgi:hypothetical protein
MNKFIAAVLVQLMVNVVSAGDTMLAVGRKSSGTTLGYENIPNRSTPVLDLNVSDQNGVIPINAQVKYLATVWGRSNTVPTRVNTTFVIYDEGNEANALMRSPNGARAVAHASSREIQAENGKAMMFVDGANFKLDRYLPKGRYQVFAYIDVSGSQVQISEVLPKGTYWWTQTSNSDGTAVLSADGTIDRNVSTAISLQYAPLTPKVGRTIEPQLSIGKFGNSVQISWNSAFPDFSLEAQAVGSSTWIPISRPGEKEVFVRDTHPTLGNFYGFKATVPADASGALFRLVPGGLTEATGAELFWPVTQR